MFETFSTKNLKLEMTKHIFLVERKSVVVKNMNLKIFN